MALSMYDASVPVFTHMLGALSAVLDKAETHCAAHKVDPSVLLQSRLYPDMFPLARQLQLATDFAKGAGARLAGVDVPSYADDETAVGELRARITKTVDFLSGLKPADFEGAETREVSLKIAGQAMNFKGQPYLLEVALPNFYFHAATAYAILRHNGVPLGKGDFLGREIQR